MHKLAASLFLLAAATANAAPETYAVDGSHSFAIFSYNHFGLADHTGKFTAISGTITVDTAQKTGSADISIDARSIVTGVPKLDEHLQSADFFDVAKYPTLTFKSKAFHFSGEALSSVDGDLTIHGVTRPVTLAVTRFACKDHPMKKVPACGANATATIKRSDFGVAAYVPAVSDEVGLSIEVEALKR